MCQFPLAILVVVTFILYCAAFSVIGKCFSCIKAQEEVKTAQICVVLGVFFCCQSEAALYIETC